MAPDAVTTLADAGRILPLVTDENRAFWTGGARGELLILRCRACGRWIHPPTSSCAACGGELRAEPVSGRGTVFTFTVNAQPFDSTIPLPYVIALVELVEQADLRLLTNVVNCAPGDVTIGMPVHVIFEDRGEIFLPVFEPEEER
jgi:uncharacterized OB-fold protein